MDILSRKKQYESTYRYGWCKVGCQQLTCFCDFMILEVFQVFSVINNDLKIVFNVNIYFLTHSVINPPATNSQGSRMQMGTWNSWDQSATFMIRTIQVYSMTTCMQKLELSCKSKLLSLNSHFTKFYLNLESSLWSKFYVFSSDILDFFSTAILLHIFQSVNFYRWSVQWLGQKIFYGGYKTLCFITA